MTSHIHIEFLFLSVPSLSEFYASILHFIIVSYGNNSMQIVYVTSLKTLCKKSILFLIQEKAKGGMDDSAFESLEKDFKEV